jgi:hypothetical protein
LEEVVVHACRKVLNEVCNNSALIVSDPKGISAQQLRPHPIHLLNIIVLTYSMKEHCVY